MDRLSSAKENKLGRERKSDPDAALWAAASLFWRNGYCEVGTRQIEAETGITRFTLQTTFGGKKRLFLAVLDQYLDNFEASAAPPESVESLDDLAAWFELRLSPGDFEEQGRNGCLMLNSVAEFGAGDGAVNERATRYFALVRERFLSAFEKLKKAGVLAPDFDAPRNSEILLACTIGMNVVIRAHGDNSAGAPIAQSAASMIRGWA